MPRPARPPADPPLSLASIATTALLVVLVGNQPLFVPPPPPATPPAPTLEAYGPPAPRPTSRPRPSDGASPPAIAAGRRAAESQAAGIAIPPDAAGVRRVPVPILLYHHVDAAPITSPVARTTTVSPTALEAHLRALDAGGWTIVALDAVVDALALGTPLPPRAVVLTFDDGWRNQFDVALPILERYGATATFFITTEPLEAGWIGSLTWDHVRALAERGMGIAAHSHTHRRFTELSDAELVAELEGPAAIIAERTGVRPRIVAYPYGDLDDRVLAAAEAAGYEAAVAASPDGEAASDALMALPRMAVHGSCDTLEAFLGCMNPWLDMAATWWDGVEGAQAEP